MRRIFIANSVGVGKLDEATGCVLGRVAGATAEATGRVEGCVAG
jgi:hypothetical protein